MASRIFAFLCLVALLSLTRFLPHPPNFSPLLAIALFAGAKAPRKWIGYLAPVAALWLGDWLIGVHYLMIITGLSLVIATGIGVFAESKIGQASWVKAILGWMGAGLAGSVVFFLITNFFVWKTSGIYPTTSEGLWSCYVMALPFFHEQILSTWFFSSALFATWAVLEPSLLAQPEN